MKKLSKKANVTSDGPWFLAGMVVACGLMGLLLIHSVQQTQYFEHIQGMQGPEFLRSIGTTACLVLAWVAGILLKFAAVKFAEELWRGCANRLSHSAT